MVDIVMVTSEDKLFWVMLVAIESVLNYSKKSTEYCFHILTTNGFDKNKIKKVRELEKSNPNVSFKFYEVEEYFVDANIHTQELGINVQTFYRLLIPQIIDREKCLYLDIDVICCGDIEELYSININKYLMAAVKAPGYVNHPNKEVYSKKNNIPDMSKYVNAGVILMNLSMMREVLFVEKALDRISNYYDSQDQDIINELCQERTLFIEPKYNLMIAQYFRDISDYGRMYTAEEINEGWSAPLIIHFAGKDKPWNGCKCLYYERWWATCLNGIAKDFFVGNLGIEYFFSLIFECNNKSIYEWKRNTWNRIVFEKKIYIYGAGYVGHRVASILEANNIDYNGFVITEKSGLEADGNIQEIEVVASEDRDALFIVGVMDDKKEEIIKNLLGKGCYKFITLNDGELY